MRVIAALLLLLLAAFGALLAWGALSNLFTEHPDSPASTYLLIGVPSLIVAVLAVAGAVRLWRAEGG